MHVQSLTRESELYDLQRLHRQVFSLHEREWNPSGADSWFRYLLALVRQPGQHVLGAFSGNQLIGYAQLSVSEDGGHLHHIGVHKSQRGAGIGRGLLSACYDCMGSRWLDLAVLEQNEPALALYRSEGFEAVGTRRVEGWTSERVPMASGSRIRLELSAAQEHQLGKYGFSWGTLKENGEDLCRAGVIGHSTIRLDGQDPGTIHAVLRRLTGPWRIYSRVQHSSSSRCTARPDVSLPYLLLRQDASSRR